MPTTINASASAGLITTADTSGVLQLQTGGTTAVTVDASQRTAFVAGTALLPAITTTGDTNTGIFFPAADQVAITTGGTQRAVVDASGNVGLGVTPNAGTSGKVFQITDAGHFMASGSTVYIDANAYFDSGWKYITSAAASNYYQSSGAHIWQTAASGTAGNTISFTQAMTLDSSGNLLVGTNSTLGASGVLQLLGSMDAQAVTRCSAASAGQYWRYGADSGNSFLVYSSNASGGVYIANASTSWSGRSDERLKDIIEPITDAANKVSNLRAVIGKFKTDEEGTRRSFLIAQDVQAVLPEAVSVSPRKEGEDTDYLGVAYTDVIPLLVAAIKEQQAIITSLTDRITALEGTTP